MEAKKRKQNCFPPPFLFPKKNCSKYFGLNKTRREEKNPSFSQKKSVICFFWKNESGVTLDLNNRGPLTRSMWYPFFFQFFFFSLFETQTAKNNFVFWREREREWFQIVFFHNVVGRGGGGGC